MATSVEPGWHKASEHHQPLFSMGGGNIGNNTHQSGPSQGGQRQGTFVANNNSSPHSYVSLNKRNMVGIPSTPYVYMPNQPTMASMPHYGNILGYDQPQAPFFQATGAYQQGMPTNGHTFPPQMAQGAANPNFMITRRPLISLASCLILRFGSSLFIF